MNILSDERLVRQCSPYFRSIGQIIEEPIKADFRLLAEQCMLNEEKRQREQLASRKQNKRRKA
jgi:hypothetical protein